MWYTFNDLSEYKIRIVITLYMNSVSFEFSVIIIISSNLIELLEMKFFKRQNSEKVLLFKIS